jgi:hypothetical protein
VQKKPPQDKSKEEERPADRGNEPRGHCSAAGRGYTRNTYVSLNGKWQIAN